ncbi:MAG TPA: hypothetical protein VHC49_00425 [Mycobacteriales bacterium]|nr:hypothetical protein [Mycobacteriales bacterium]
MKHLVDLDEDALDRARRQLGTDTIKSTVNAALRLASAAPPDEAGLDRALDSLAAIDFADRSAAWR